MCCGKTLICIVSYYLRFAVKYRFTARSKEYLCAEIRIAELVKKAFSGGGGFFYHFFKLKYFIIGIKAPIIYHDIALTG